LQTDDPTPGPLAAIKMVDLTRGMPGAIATMLLADYGADVVKVERPLGNPLESLPAYSVWNRGTKTCAGTSARSLSAFPRPNGNNGWLPRVCHVAG